MGCAQTGTGKTAAFALPMLDLLSGRPPKKPGAIRALILTPTRELALQIETSFEQYGQYLKLRPAVIFGGVGQEFIRINLIVLWLIFSLRSALTYISVQRPNVARLLD